MLTSIVVLTIVVALLVVYTAATQNDVDPIFSGLKCDVVSLGREIADLRGDTDKLGREVADLRGPVQPGSTFDLKVVLRDETTYLIKDATSYVFKYREANGNVGDIELLQVYKDGNEGNNAFAVFVYDEVSAVIKEDN